MSAPLVRLPSLDLVRGFVAVGRRMSITLAAQDLCLTQSAVSRQILALEESLGCKLLLRGHRSVSFTPAGERFFRSADSAIQQMQDVVGELKGGSGPRTVTLTATVAVAGLWLIPRLGRFLDSHPDIEVRLSASNRVVDLKGEGIDLALRYGDGTTMPEQAEHLFDERIVPVAHPSLGVDELSDPAQLAGQVLLEFDGPYRPWLQWRDWLAARGWEKAPVRATLRFNQYDQIIHAAVAGQGIALGRRPLIDAMLADGRLRAIAAPGDPASPHAFWLLRRQGDNRPEVAEVVNWILAEAGGKS